MARHAVAPYAERLNAASGAFDLAALSAWGVLDAQLSGRLRGRSHANRVRQLAASFTHLSDAGLLAEAAMLRPRLLREADALRPHVFALVHLAVERQLGLRYHTVQLNGGLALSRRQIVEMATGEGKTITAVLPAAAAALGGRPVHVITVNDYLAARDAERLRPVYAALGLSVGLIQEGMQLAERRAAYACDVTYVTNKELTFDYLKDRIATAASRGDARHKVASLFGAAPQGLLLRGLHVAIIDEADSVLIDEARTPLIISADREPQGLVEMTSRALSIAISLTPREHFLIDETNRTVLLSPSGQHAVAEQSEGFDGLFRARHARLQLVTQALTALYLFERDKHYIIANGEVQIVDEYTGRVMADRKWEQGLHQLVEAKEGVALTGTRETLARIPHLGSPPYPQLFTSCKAAQSLEPFKAPSIHHFSLAAEAAAHIVLPFKIPV